MERLVGPDVSFWQDDPTTERTIDFKRMASMTPFVFIRAGQNLWPDKVFPASWKLAKEAGLLRGSYWFYDSRANPEAQAELYIKTLGKDLGELPLVADFEDRYGGSFGTWEDWYRFLERVKLLSGNKETMIYTGYYYWIEKTVTLPKNTLSYFAKFPLWIAQYGTMDSPKIPAPWSSWLFWQFTDNGNGEPYGVESRNIDLNYFNGDIEAFRKRFDVVNAEKPSPDFKIRIRIK